MVWPLGFEKACSRIPSEQLSTYLVLPILIDSYEFDERNLGN